MVQGTRTSRHGLYRIRASRAKEDCVWVEDLHGGPALQLAASAYRLRAYAPPLESLPWREEFYGLETAATGT